MKNGRYVTSEKTHSKERGRDLTGTKQSRSGQEVWCPSQIDTKKKKYTSAGVACQKGGRGQV